MSKYSVLLIISSADNKRETVVDETYAHWNTAKKVFDDYCKVYVADREACILLGRVSGPNTSTTLASKSRYHTHVELTAGYYEKKARGG